MKQIKNSMLYLIPILLIILIPYKVKADQIRLTPHVDYVYPTSIQTFSNRVISDDRYWGVTIPNTSEIQSLVFGYDYTTPVAGDLYDYVFKVYSDREPPKFVLNGHMCQTQATMIGGTAQGTTIYYDSVSMIYCNDVPSSNGLQLTMYNEFVNVYGNSWNIGISWQVSVTRKSSNSNQIVNDLNDIKNTDINNSDKQQPNQDNYDNVQQQEEIVYDSLDDIDINTLIDMNIDINTSNWIWNTITSILQANARVMAMVISILSLGLCKFVLGR